MLKKYFNLPYRECVGIMLLNKENKVFVGRRIDTDIEAWQMPQGGINDGEEPKVAALRELEEETGISKVEVISESKGYYSYDLPEDLIPKLWGQKYRGQKQKWFLMSFLGDDSNININTKIPEFSSWNWVSKDSLLKHVVPFKAEVYKNVIKEFNSFLEN